MTDCHADAPAMTLPKRKTGDEPCTCGHAREEHGHDEAYPGSTACTECECCAYEGDPES